MVLNHKENEDFQSLLKSVNNIVEFRDSRFFLVMKGLTEVTFKSKDAQLW